MRFRLQDVKKSVHRRGGELAVTLHMLREGELHAEIERLIAYHEQLLGRPQRRFSLDEAQACIGDYRLAHCLIATLSNWYSWRQRDWTEVIRGLGTGAELADIASPMHLRLALYSYVNEHHHGFLGEQAREEALRAFADPYRLSATDLEYLLTLDSEEEALLARESAQPPDEQAVATLYNQWAFEAALFNASSVRFVVDCTAFATQATNGPQWLAPTIGTGVGAVIKRLCYLARKLGIYYDLAYEGAPPGQAAAWGGNTLLALTLYGPQEVTGAPQQYGLRLARLCRMLLGYGNSQYGEQGRVRKRSAFSRAIVEAEATVHFLQRSYSFVLDDHLLHLLPSTTDDAQRNGQSERASTENLFDSSIEQGFSEAFSALSDGQGMEGWRLEREPEPLLLERGIFIPDFAFTRERQRIYVEILGFWTPSYRERKIQKLQQLQGRHDLLLAIPIEAKEAFQSIAGVFPIVYYNGQLGVGDIVQVLRERYDDFAERLALLDHESVRERVRREGLLTERACYEALRCYRRSELQQAAELVIESDIAFVSGIGLYTTAWLEETKQAFLTWLRAVRALSLAEAARALREQRAALRQSEEATIETLLGLWPEVQIRRDSIFEAVVELVGEPGEAREEQRDGPAREVAEKRVRKRAGEKRPAAKKRVVQESMQGDLWGM